MSYTHLLQLKPLLMVLAAAAGTVTGGVMVNSFNNTFGHKDPGSFLLTLNPSSMTVVENMSATSTITVTSIGGFTGIVTLSTSFPGTSIAATVNPTSVTVLANGQAESTLSITAPATAGNYSIVVTGVSTSHSRTTYSSAMLAVQAVSSQDFAVSISPSIIISPLGSTNTTTVTVTSLNAYAGNVSLTFTAPFGFLTVTGGQKMLSLTSGGTASTSLTIKANGATLIGTYTVTVTGTSGHRSHTATVTVQVVDPNPVIVESLGLTGHAFNNSTMLTLSLRNTGNGTISLTSYVVRDSSGDSWTLTNWNGPTIQVGQTGQATVIIGMTSCFACTYTGITGLFNQFLPGQSYTVTVITSRNNQFTYTIAY